MISLTFMHEKMRLPHWSIFNKDGFVNAQQVCVLLCMVPKGCASQVLHQIRRRQQWTQSALNSDNRTERHPGSMSELNVLHNDYTFINTSTPSKPTTFYSLLGTTEENTPKKTIRKRHSYIIRNKTRHKSCWSLSLPVLIFLQVVSAKFSGYR